MSTHIGEKPVTHNGKRITRQHIMREALRLMLDIEDQFNTATRWNRLHKEEEPINPDPNGELAEMWLNFHEELLGLSLKYRPVMEAHFSKYRPKAGDGTFPFISNGAARSFENIPNRGTGSRSAVAIVGISQESNDKAGR
jgi:hypothetical protein